MKLIIERSCENITFNKVSYNLVTYKYKYLSDKRCEKLFNVKDINTELRKKKNRGESIYKLEDNKFFIIVESISMDNPTIIDMDLRSTAFNATLNSTVPSRMINTKNSVLRYVIDRSMKKYFPKVFCFKHLESFNKNDVIFEYYKNHDYIIGLENLNFDLVEDINYSFSNITSKSIIIKNKYAPNLKEAQFAFASITTNLLRVKNFIAPKLTDISYLMDGSRVGNIDLSGFICERCKRVCEAFCNCSACTIDIGGINLLNVEDFTSMFSNCFLAENSHKPVIDFTNCYLRRKVYSNRRKTSVKFSKMFSKFGAVSSYRILGLGELIEKITKQNSVNHIDMSLMFSNCSCYKMILDLRGFTAKNIGCSVEQMFFYSKFNQIIFKRNLTIKTRSVYSLFRGACISQGIKNLSSLTIEGCFNFAQSFSYSTDILRKNTKIFKMKPGKGSLNGKKEIYKISLDSMFEGAISVDPIKSILDVSPICDEINKLAKKKYINVNMTNMFHSAALLRRIKGLNLSSDKIIIENLNSTFRECACLRTIDLSNLNLSCCGSYRNTFSEDIFLRSVKGLDKVKIDISKIKYLYSKFGNEFTSFCPLDINAAFCFTQMFYLCKRLQKATIPGFTKNYKFKFREGINLNKKKFYYAACVSFIGTFNGCSELKTVEFNEADDIPLKLDLSLLSSVPEKISYSMFPNRFVSSDYTYYMFESCSKLESIKFPNLYVFLNNYLNYNQEKYFLRKGLSDEKVSIYNTLLGKGLESLKTLDISKIKIVNVDNSIVSKTLDINYIECFDLKTVITRKDQGLIVTRTNFR